MNLQRKESFLRDSEECRDTRENEDQHPEEDVDGHVRRAQVGGQSGKEERDQPGQPLKWREKI